ILAVISAVSIGGGILVIVQPEFTRDIVRAVFLNRSHSIKLLDLWLAGLVRIAIGVLIILGLMRYRHTQDQTVQNASSVEQ
ncbi:MAG: hypothetical protein QHI38_05625, partial [Armatimonadota bacterium]|nr:hypothetical protein [Armatimonadota bacterium]